MGNWGVIILLSGVGFPIYNWLFAHLVATITTESAPTLPLLSHIAFWALINMESSTTGGINLVGAWTNPFENIQPSNWIMKPQGSGVNMKTYLSCHHLVIHKVQQHQA